MAQRTVFWYVCLLLLTVSKLAECSRVRSMLRRGCRPPCTSLVLPLSRKPISDDIEVVLHYVNTPAGKIPLFMCRNCGCDLCKQALALGFFAAPTTQVFHHVLEGKCKEGTGLVVDAGANIGYFTLMAAAGYGCRVIAFEPNPGPRLYLKASVDLHETQGLVKIYPVALGASAATATFEAKNGRWAHTAVSLVPPATNSTNVTSNAMEARAKQVAVRPMSDFVKQDMLLLKVDTENFESEVFEGAWPMLGKYNVENVVVEVKDFNSPAKRALLNKIFQTGKFKYVYSYKEEYWTYKGLIQNARVNGTDVTDAISYNNLKVKLPYEDFWFSKENRASIVWSPQSPASNRRKLTGTPAPTGEASATGTKAAQTVAQEEPSVQAEPSAQAEAAQSVTQARGKQTEEEEMAEEMAAQAWWHAHMLGVGTNEQ